MKYNKKRHNPNKFNLKVKEKQLRVKLISFSVNVMILPKVVILNG